MAAPLFPLVLAGGAALVLLGGKKKKTSSASRAPDPSEQETSDEEADEGEGASGYGTVASGTRRDKRGTFAWRVKYDADGYHAQILMSATRFSPVQEEVGVAASLKAAKGLLRDRFNELLLEKYPSEKAIDDPSDSVTATVANLNLG